MADMAKLPVHSIADQVQKVANDSQRREQQEPRRGLLVHALNEFHLSTFCAAKRVQAS